MKPDTLPPYLWRPLSEDVERIKMISRRMFTGKFYFWLIYEMWEAEENESFTGAKVWRIDVCLIAPEKISRDEWESCFNSVGGENWLEQPVEARVMAEVIHDAGGARAPIFNVESRKNCDALLAADRMLKSAMTDLRATLDKPVNKIGTTGWEALEGKIMAGLGRKATNPEQERANKLMRKLGGMREDDADHD